MIYSNKRLIKYNNFDKKTIKDKKKIPLLIQKKSNKIYDFIVQSGETEEDSKIKYSNILLNSKKWLIILIILLYLK